MKHFMLLLLLSLGACYPSAYTMPPPPEPSAPSTGPWATPYLFEPQGLSGEFSTISPYLY